MQRYFTADKITEETFLFQGEIFHHVKHVMRQKMGENFLIVDGNSKTFLIEITALEDEFGEGLIKRQLHEEKELPVEITIACGFPKGDKLEFIAQKVTELGASQLVAFPAQSSVVKWDEKKRQKKTERLNKIMQEAAEQSHRQKMPEATLFKTFSAFITSFSQYDKILVAYEEESKQGEKKKLRSFLETVKPGEKVLAIFGPEGGLSPNEIGTFEEHLALIAALGPRILRAETAPLYFLAAASYALELGEEA